MLAHLKTAIFVATSFPSEKFFVRIPRWSWYLQVEGTSSVTWAGGASDNCVLECSALKLKSWLAVSVTWWHQLSPPLLN